MHNHAFYMTLAYGLSAVLLLAEVAVLCLRWRKACAARQEGECL